MKKIFLSVLIVFIYASVSSACIGLIGASGKINGPMSKGERRKYAIAIKEEIQKIHDSIPNLSPTEKKWLEDELSSTSNAPRMLKALNSDEFLLKNTKENTETLLIGLNRIIDEAYMDPKQEVLLWSVIATAFSNIGGFSEGIRTLVEREKIKFSDDKEYGTRLLDYACNGQGQTILKYIIIPYLADKMPK